MCGLSQAECRGRMGRVQAVGVQSVEVGIQSVEGLNAWLCAGDELADCQQCGNVLGR